MEIIKLPENNSKFYTFTQNNSGGSFHRNENVSHFVIIEAHSNHEANKRAREIGIYFDGCSEGLDCNCCGDRWSEAWTSDGDLTPLIYDIPPVRYNDRFCSDGESYCIVYYLGGIKSIHRK